LWNCWDFLAPPAVIPHPNNDPAPGESCPPCPRAFTGPEYHAGVRPHCRKLVELQIAIAVSHAAWNCAKCMHSCSSGIRLAALRCSRLPSNYVCTMLLSMWERHRCYCWRVWHADWTVPLVAALRCRLEFGLKNIKKLNPDFHLCRN